jgi:hypothetical protein
MLFSAKNESPNRRGGQGNSGYAKHFSPLIGEYAW